MKRKLRKITTRFVCCMAAIVLMLGTMPSMVSAETNKEKLERLKNELAQIQEEKEALEASKSNAQGLLVLYQQEMELREAWFEANRIDMEETRAAIEVKQGEISEKRETIYENQELFEERLVAIYKMNNAGFLSTLLNVNTYSDLVTMSNAMQLIAQNDTAFLQMLADEKEALEREYDELDALLAELEQKDRELKDEIDKYAANIQQQNAAISAAEAAVAANEVAYGQKADDVAAAQAAYDAELAAAANLKNKGSNSSDGSQYEGGAFQWPVSGYYNVSCEYGSPDPNGRPHRGMDIAGGGITGANISACADGTVIVVDYNHYSYGAYVVVDHGGGLKTLYAHCSAIYVSVGSTVSKGDDIAAVGSTGFVTGAHLHLEVHLNGALQNPRSYFG